MGGLDALLRVRIHCTAPVRVGVASGLSIQSTRAALEDSRSGPAQCQVDVKDTIAAVLDLVRRASSRGETRAIFCCSSRYQVREMPRVSWTGSGIQYGRSLVAPM